MAPTPTELKHRGTGDITDHPLDEPDSDQSEQDAVALDSSRKLVGIDGKWYDVTNFLAVHPGGPIIEQFVGKDATTVFHAYGHDASVLKHRKPVGTYKMTPKHPADPDFDALVKKFKEWGWYETDWMFYVKKISFALSLWLSVFICVIAFDQWYMHYLGAVILAFVWQQSGFILHEFMHTQVFRKQPTDRYFGVMFGTTLFGMSAHWWREEHIIHHAMTNTVDAFNRFADPQMWESVWAQNEKMYPLFKGYLQYCLIKIQHITFVPVVTMFGRYEIITDSYRLERRWYEWIAIVCHWIWMCFLLSHLATWREVFTFYFIAATVEGIFHFQLILSHYCKLFLKVDEFHNTSWYVFQVLSNMNIDTPRWQDWYYGGLNYHIEHHLFPRLGRKHLRSAGKYVKEICDKHGIDYDSCSFTEALVKTLKHLKVAGTHYKLDPR